MALMSIKLQNHAKSLVSKLTLIACSLCLCSDILPSTAQQVPHLSPHVINSYTDPTNTGAINHMVVHALEKKVYVAALNRLYQLNERLEVEKTETTGPQLDSPNCPPSGDCDDEFEKLETDCYNKALVVDTTNRRLIVCNNLFQGRCEKYRLGDINSRDDPLEDVAIVSSDMVSSAFLFIAPGPSDAQVLYVGATRSTEGIRVYRDLVPAVSSRRLDSLNLVSRNPLSMSKIDIDIQQRENFRVRYVYGFGSGGFSYFLTVQKDSLESPNYVTRILRVCQEDVRYVTYTEVPLECNYPQGNETINYNILVAAYVMKPGSDLAHILGVPDVAPRTGADVLFGLFAKSGPESDSADPLPGTVMCVYPLRDIRRQFTAAIQQCFKGVGNTGPAHFTLPGGCTPTKLQIGDEYCGSYPFNHPIAGSTPLAHEAIAHFPDALATSLLVTSASHNYTVAFIGTHDGAIKKVVIESGEEAVEYASVKLQPGDDSPINPEMALHYDNKTIYVTTDKRVMRVLVENCSQYTTCSDCLGARDPYCGWCSLENRCMIRQACIPDEDVGKSAALRWLPYKDAQCSRILHVQPRQVQKQKKETTELLLHVQNLPKLPEDSNKPYKCSFKGYGVTRHTHAIVQPAEQQQGTMAVNNTIQCSTPAPNLVPHIPTGKVKPHKHKEPHDKKHVGKKDRKHKRKKKHRKVQDHLVMVLSISTGDKDLVSVNFTFFDCGRHDSCTSCTESNFPCTWCVKEHVCVEDRETCGSDFMITGRNVPGPTDNPGPELCPRIQASFTEILVPAGTTTQITIRSEQLLPFQSYFQCEFEMDGTTEEVNAGKRGQQFIECDSMKFEYSGNTRHRNVPFRILWSSADDPGEWLPLDNPSNIQVKVFKCSAMANSCGACLTQDAKYSCGWCMLDGGSSMCSQSKECHQGEWLNNSQTCPNPRITRFSPSTGPLNGGTRITIDGENLGKLFDDIKSGVTVANRKCITDTFDSLYDPARRIVCETGSSSRPASGPVQVNVNNRHVATSDEMFYYVEPKIESFSPNRGPQSGGTRLTVKGQHLNSGTAINATVAGLPCLLDRAHLSEREVMCTTPASASEIEGHFQMNFDRNRVTHRESYRYMADPNITQVTPQHGILNGGTSITVLGSNLDIVQEPKMVVFVSYGEYTSDCVTSSKTMLVCDSPSIEGSGVQSNFLKLEEPLVLSYGFLLDAVVELKNYTRHTKGASVFTIFPNPQIVEFESGVKSMEIKKNEQYLTIRGKNLNVALGREDYQVKVGKGDCIISEVSTDKIFCTPPDPSEDGVGENAEVVVLAGTNLTFTAGMLKYESTEVFPSHYVIIGAVAVGAVLLFIIVLICVAYKRKSKESERVRKRMTNQMDILEARVAKECKEAFAELQTDMTELTSDLYGPSGIPFHDYKTFTMKVLFPGDDEHPVTRPFDVETNNSAGLEHGLRQFNQLIGNKLFLLLFIRTLESHKSFTMRERVNVASLISVALQDRMEYHTEILKTLLAELIERSMEGRNHPKLLLRRTESVAEKMLTNWFTFMLYKFLKECAGEPLYMLFKAIKQQVDKGPVDALTSEARYSLSEDKLIRQQIEYRVMTIHVLDMDNQRAPEHAVKVLDCDTISQVKEKILDTVYKTGRYSRRPHQSVMDLEWRTGVKGRVILQDVDQTTSIDSDHKRLNTLSHYKVPDGAVMSLIPIQNSMYSFSNCYDPYNSGSPSLSRSVTPHTLSLGEVENGARCYHLVKHHDSDQQKEGDRGSKMVSEVYLTRLLATKGTLQQFVDDLFETIFSTTNRGTALPLAIKYMFDFLDDQALHHGVTDPEVVHTWKSNSLPLRFWVNVVKNPDFVFDINKSNIVDSCLSVVAQTFMDSCSISDTKLSKDSPSSKLLYAKDIPKYKQWVDRYYTDIKLIPAISDQDMNTMLAEESRSHLDEFTLNAALHELYHYVMKYNDDLMTNLEEDEFARNHKLPYKLEQVHRAMESDL